MLRLRHCQNVMMLHTITFEEYSCKGFRLITFLITFFLWQIRTPGQSVARDVCVSVL